MALSSYLIPAAPVLLIELLRRCYNAFIFAFTGPLSKVPGPALNKLSSIPHLISLARGTSMFYHRDLQLKYGGIVRTEPNSIIVSDQDLVNKILVEWDLPKAELYKDINNVQPDGISIITEMNKDRHKQRKRLLSRGFSPSYLKSLEPLMLSCLDVMKEVIDQACSDGGGSSILDMFAILSGLTFDVMSEASFGGSFEEVRLFSSPPDSMKSMLVRLTSLNALHAALPFVKYVPWIIPPLKVPELEKRLGDIVRRRRDAISKGEVIRKDLLQIFLDAQEEDRASFTEMDIHSEMKFFAVAGSDTSSTTIIFVLRYLLENPDTLDALIEEVDAGIASPNDPITAKTTRNLPYMNAVIYETLRLMPAVAGGHMRQTLEPLQLGDYLIPAGTQITVDHYSLQRDSRIWPDADSFVPDRWLVSHKNEDALYTFSAGSRVCIGKQFAMMEMRLILATLVRCYDIRLVPGQSREVRNMFVLHMKEGKYFVDFRKRL